MKKILILTCMLSLLVGACNKSKVEPVTENSTPVNLDFLITRLQNADTLTSAIQGYETYNFLGYGYDLTEKFSHESSVRVAVINIPELEKAYPNRFVFSRITSSSFYSIFAENAEKLTRSLTYRVNDYEEQDSVNYFRGNITQPFPQTDPLSGKYIYGLYDLYVTLTRPTLYAFSDQVKDYLTEEFKTDRELLEPKELVEKYGTHILRSLYTGAKLSIDYQAEYMGQKRQEAVENSFRLGLSENFGLFSGFLDPVDSSALKDISDPKMVFEIIGGDASKVMLDETGPNTVVNIQDWRKSITEENARFIYLDDGINNLYPLHEMIADGTKKEAVKKYVEEYIKSKGVKIE